MFIEPFVDEGLGNSSYLVASEAAGLAAVVDPQRDVDGYLRRAEALGLRLQYALDTHLHNDFVSGVRELAALAGVQVGASALAELGFDHRPLREGDALSLGDLALGVLATPGRTLDAFVAAATADLPSYPTYFHAMRALNQRGPAVLGGLPALGPLAAEQVRAHQAAGAAVVDLRRTPEFVAGHIPGAHGVALRAEFGTWVGWVVAFGTPLVLITHGDPAEHETAVRQLIRLGYDNLLGYLKGGMDAWQAAGYDVERG
ncbi:MAG: hypothetical protein IT318_24980 [Anaerolineales bacterium]|nr:hypothetical protein [Anaerolineales bacterium]